MVINDLYLHTSDTSHSLGSLNFIMAATLSATFLQYNMFKKSNQLIACHTLPNSINALVTHDKINAGNSRPSLDLAMLSPCAFSESCWSQMNAESFEHSQNFRRTTQQTQNMFITFVQRRPNVFDVGPTLYKCFGLLGTATYYKHDKCQSLSETKHPFQRIHIPPPPPPLMQNRPGDIMKKLICMLHFTFSMSNCEQTLPS